MKGKGEREEKKRREKGKEEGEGEETYTLRSQNGHWRGLRTRLDILSNTASQLTSTTYQKSPAVAKSLGTLNICQDEREGFATVRDCGFPSVNVWETELRDRLESCILATEH